MICCTARYFNLLRPVLWLSCLHVAFISTFVFAEDLKNDEPEKIDAVLLLDASASMRMTDPQRLRSEGAKLFTEFLKSDDNLSIVEFSDKAEIVRPLEPFDPKARAQVTAQIEQVGDEGLYTDIFAAIKLAESIIKDRGRADARPVIILFSDGMMEPDPKTGEAEILTNELLLTVLPELKAGGIKVHTLAFSPEADKELLSQIAANTNGMNWFTPEPERIHEAFASLFLVVKKPQIVPLTSRGFRIDENVKEATFYINREGDEELYLIDPSETRLSAEDATDNITWFKGKQFDVVTVVSPQVGDWQISGLPSRDSFATVLTNLKLVTSWPSIINSGDRNLLQARLYEADKPVFLPDISDVARYAFQITPTDRVSPPVVREALNDEGKNGDKVMRDGIFSSYVKIEEPGEYRLDVIARLPTFERSQQIPFNVRPRIVSVNVIFLEKTGAAIDLDAEGSDGIQHEGKEYFEVRLSPDATRLSNPDISLYAIDKDRRKLKLPLDQTVNKEQLLAPVAALPQEGAYLIEATFVAKDKRGKKVEAVSSKLQYVLQGKKAESETVEVVEVAPVEEEKEPVDKKPTNWPYFVLVLVANAAFGGFTIFQVKNGQTIGKITIPQYETPPSVMSAIQSLQEKLATAEIDLDDPRFSEENLAQLPAGGKKEEVGDVEARESSSTPESSSQENIEAEGQANTDEQDASSSTEEATTTETEVAAPAEAEPEAEALPEEEKV